MIPETLAFVIPWYGPEIPGGAESLCREWAQQLSQAGKRVEVLTTTIKEFQSNWNQPAHQPGTTQENGVTVRRFQLRPGDHFAFNAINQKLLSGLPVSSQEEKTFFRESANSEDLVQFIRGHREEYVFVFLPYLYGTTYYGLRAAPQRSILLPCLHREPYAALSGVRETFEMASGLIFNSRPERNLAESLYNLKSSHQIILGMGLDPDIRGDAVEFSRKFKQERPFLLYVGRKDVTKNTDLLMAYFEKYQKLQATSSLQLILAGRGRAGKPHHSIRDLGFLSLQDKYNAYAAATAFCNPSVNESFSIVLMESWLCGAPALVHADCEVTRAHVEESKGGLYFRDYYEFETCLDYLIRNPDESSKMASAGADYVREHFSWPDLRDCFLGFVERLFGKTGELESSREPAS